MTVLASMSLGLHTMIKQALKEGPEKVHKVLEMTMKEILDLAEALLTLTGNGSNEIKSSSDGAAVLGRALGPKCKASCQVIRHLVSQSPFWRATERQARQAASAEKSFGPEMKEMMENLKDPDFYVLADLPKACQRVSVWNEALRSGRPHVEHHDAFCCGERANPPCDCLSVCAGVTVNLKNLRLNLQELPKIGYEELAPRILSEPRSSLKEPSRRSRENNLLLLVLLSLADTNAVFL